METLEKMLASSYGTSLWNIFAFISNIIVASEASHFLAAMYSGPYEQTISSLTSPFSSHLKIRNRTYEFMFRPKFRHLTFSRFVCGGKNLAKAMFGAELLIFKEWGPTNFRDVLFSGQKSTARFVASKNLSLLQSSRKSFTCNPQNVSRLSVRDCYTFFNRFCICARTENHNRTITYVGRPA